MVVDTENTRHDCSATQAFDEQVQSVAHEELVPPGRYRCGYSENRPIFRPNGQGERMCREGFDSLYPCGGEVQGVSGGYDQFVEVEVLKKKNKGTGQGTTKTLEGASQYAQRFQRQTQRSEIGEEEREVAFKEGKILVGPGKLEGDQIHSVVYSLLLQKKNYCLTYMHTCDT
jgi:hypothetical protein